MFRCNGGDFRRPYGAQSWFLAAFPGFHGPFALAWLGLGRFPPLRQKQGRRKDGAPRFCGGTGEKQMRILHSVQDDTA